MPKITAFFTIKSSTHLLFLTTSDCDSFFPVSCFAAVRQWVGQKLPIGGRSGRGGAIRRPHFTIRLSPAGEGPCREAGRRAVLSRRDMTATMAPARPHCTAHTIASTATLHGSHYSQHGHTARLTLQPAHGIQHIVTYLHVGTYQARIQGGGGAGADAQPWGGFSPLKMHDSIAFMHQSIIGRPPLGEILHPPLLTNTRLGMSRRPNT